MFSILVNIGIIAIIYNFVKNLEQNFEKSKKYFNGLFAIMIYQIFDSLSIESDLSLTVSFVNYRYGGFFIFLIFFLIPVIIVSILNSKHLEQNTLSLVDVPNNKSSVDKITNIPNYDQLVELKSMKKLHRTNTLNIVQLINQFIIIGIIGFGGIIVLFLLIFGGFEEAIPVILISAMLIFIMLWFIKGLNQYKKEVRLFYSVFIALEFLFGLFWIYEISDDFLILLIIPVFQIYTLFIHKPTSDYFEL